MKNVAELKKALGTGGVEFSIFAYQPDGDEIHYQASFCKESHYKHATGRGKTVRAAIRYALYQFNRKAFDGVWDEDDEKERLRDAAASRSKHP